MSAGNDSPTPYEDVAGFCVAAARDDLVENGFVLTPGRYVGSFEAELGSEPIEQKLLRLRTRLVQEFEESERLEAIVRRRLESLLP